MSPSNVPLNATEVALNLANLARDLDTTVKQLKGADEDATTKRVAYDLAFSRAFMRGEGSVDGRKHQAVIATEAERTAAEVADALVRHLRRRIDALRVRIEVGRSYSAAIRAEIALGQAGGQP